MEVPIVAAVVAASATVITGFVGKWIDSHHKHTDVLRNKLEDYFRSLDRLMQSAWHPKYPDLEESISEERRALRYRVAWHDQQQSLTIAIMDCHMICEIYFPSLIGRTNVLMQLVKNHGEWMSDIGDEGYPIDMDKINESFGRLNLEVASLKQHLVGDQSYLTKKWPNWFEHY